MDKYYIRVNFEVDFGLSEIDSVKYSIFGLKNKYRQFYIDENPLTYYHDFEIPLEIYVEMMEDGEKILSKIEIKDKNDKIHSYKHIKIIESEYEKPYVYDLKFYQRNDGSKIVDMDYTYKGLSEINNSTVTFQISEDQGQNFYDVNEDDLRGDFGSNVHPGRRKISWKPSDYYDGKHIKSRIILYDTDNNADFQNSGIVRVDLKPPESSVILRKSPYTDDRIILKCNDCYKMEEEKSYKFHLDCMGTASVDINENKIKFGVVNGRFIWGIGESYEYVFEYEGEKCYFQSGIYVYSVVMEDFSCVCFSVKYIETLPYLYVAVDGDDDNPGSEELPFATIQKGIDSATDGYTVVVKNGIYEIDCR